MNYFHEIHLMGQREREITKNLTRRRQIAEAYPEFSLRTWLDRLTATLRYLGHVRKIHIEVSFDLQPVLVEKEG